MGAEPARGRNRPPHARDRAPRTSLTRRDVVEAALHLLQTEGSTALSMRRVAQHLGVGTMSLYWHVADRDELLDLVFDEVVSDQLLDEVPADWRSALREIAHRARAMFERYPWVLDFGPRVRIGAVVLDHVEQSIAATESMGLPMASRLAAVSAVDHYVLGYVMEAHARPAHEPVLTPDAQAAVDAGRYPRYAAFVADDAAASRAWDDAQDFDTGLELLLAGIAAAVDAGSLPVGGQLPRRRTARRRSTS